MDLTTIVTDVAQALLSWETLIIYMGYALSAYLCGSSIVAAAKKSTGPHANVSMGKVLGGIIIGALMLNFQQTMADVSASMNGTDTAATGLLSYDGASSAGQFAGAINSALTIISVFGWWYGLQGFMLLRKASSGESGGGYEDYAWKGIVHILGGAALINITSTLDAATATVNMSF